MILTPQFYSTTDIPTIMMLADIDYSEEIENRIREVYQEF